MRHKFIFFVLCGGSLKRSDFFQALDGDFRAYISDGHQKKTNFLTHDLSTNHNSEDSMADIRRLLQIPKPSEDPTLGD